MWNPPTQKQLEKIPALYSQDGKGPEKTKVRMHFFIGGCDWYVTEYDSVNRLFYCFAILNGDTQNAEWGYSSLDEMMGVRSGFVEIDRDMHWKVRPVTEVKEIVACSSSGVS